MASIITIAQQKGGAGKTSLAANLAAVLAAERRVAVLDTDPQRSLIRWHAIRTARTGPALPVITASDVSGWRLQGELDRLQREFDIVLVDSAPQVDQDARRAIRAAALVLVPVQPSAPDIWAAEGTLRLAKEEHRPAHLVLNRVAAGARAASAATSQAEAAAMRLLGTMLGNRAAYPQAFAAGLGVTEAAPRSIAAEEVRRLAAEITALL